MLKNQLEPDSKAMYAERRQESRLAAHGTVRIRPYGQQEFLAVVVNSSHGGLCIRHWHKGLTAGEELLVCSSSEEELTVRVAWNWMVGPVVMSGLQLLDPLTAPVTALADSETALTGGQIRNSLALAGITFLILIL